MNLLELQTLVNYRRRDTTTTFISNEEVQAYLNEGLRKATAAYEYDWNKVSTTFTYTDGYTHYQLSSVASDLDEPIDIFYTDDYRFDCVSPKEFMMLSGQNVNIFAIDNAELLVHTTFGTGTLSLNYYTVYTCKTSGGSLLANLSSSTDEPLMPEQFQDLLVDFAAARCYQKEGMYDDFKIAYQDFMTGLRTIQSKIPSRKKHYPKRMVNGQEATVNTLDAKQNPLNTV